jgi:hypothetical protein
MTTSTAVIRFTSAEGRTDIEVSFDPAAAGPNLSPAARLALHALRAALLNAQGDTDHVIQLH